MAPRKKFLLRLNADLHAEVETWAREEFRSVNGQIEFLLRQAVLRRKGSAPPLQSETDAPTEDDANET